MRIILVIDYSRRSERIVRELAERPWPCTTVIRVLAMVENTPPSAAELWFDAAGSLETVMQTRKERSGKLADEAAAVLRAKGLTVETSVRAGRVRRAIKEEVKQWPADLVIADRGLRRFSFWKSPSFSS
jgi:nucleotide-binding universal stress UspA family protein